MLQEYRELHEERSRRIKELTAEVHGLGAEVVHLREITAEVHGVRAEVVHLREMMAKHDIPVPPRVSG